MLKLLTFGTLALKNGEQVTSGVGAQRSRLAILALLAAHGNRGLTRDKLLGYFWADSDSERARSALKQATYALRIAMRTEPLIVGSTTVMLNSAVITSDVAELQQAYATGDHLGVVALYDGAFLDGIHIRQAPEFERWSEAERARYARYFARALDALAERAEASSEWKEAVLWRERLVAHDSYGSRARLTLMRALAHSGDIPAAIEQARQYESLVRSDLDLDADPAVLGLARDLRAQAVKSAYSSGNDTVAPRLNGDESGEQVARARPSDPSVAISIDGTGMDETRPMRRDQSARTRPLVFERAAPRRGFVIAAVITIALALVTLAWTTGQPSFFAARNDAAPLISNRVVVIPFENHTGDSTADVIGLMAADWISEGIAQTGIAEVVTLSTVQKAFSRTNTDPAGRRPTTAAPAVAGAVGAGLVIAGAYYLEDQELTFRAHVTDAVKQTMVGGTEPVRAAKGTISEALEVVRQRTMGLLALRFDERSRAWSKDISRPPHYQAYVAYMDGLVAATFEEKERHFVHAIDIDPSFARAWLAALDALGEPPTQSERFGREWPDSGRAILARSRNAMSPADRHHFDAYSAALRQDWLAQYGAMRRAASYAPDKRPDLAIAAFNLGRYREMVDTWLSTNTPALLRPPEPVATKQVTAALHFLGQHERELVLAREGKKLHPRHVNFLEMELTALAATGRIAEIEHSVHELLSGGGLTGWHYKPASLLLTLGTELTLHGYSAAAERVLRRAETLQRSELERLLGSSLRTAGVTGVFKASGRVHPHTADRRTLGRILLWSGRPEEGRRFWRELYAETGQPEDLTLLGIAAARAGDRMEALRVMERLERAPWSPAWRGPWNRAQVAGALENCEEMVTLLQASFAEGALHQFLHRPLGFHFCRDHVAFKALVKPKG